MKQALLFLALFTSLTAAAQAPTPIPGTPRKKYLRPQKDKDCAFVQNVTKNTDEDSDQNGTLTRLAYRPYTELLTEIDALRKMNNWADTTYQRRFSTLPPGGVLVVTMYRQGAKNADPSALSVVGKDEAGKELFAQTLAAGAGRFWNRDQYVSQRIIPFVKQETPQSVAVTITDAKLKQNFEYVVNPQ
jgi:hypothetical protein